MTGYQCVFLNKKQCWWSTWWGWQNFCLTVCVQSWVWIHSPCGALHVPPVPVWYCGFLPQHTDMYVSFTGESKLAVSVYGCLSLCAVQGVPNLSPYDSSHRLHPHCDGEMEEDGWFDNLSQPPFSLETILMHVHQFLTLYYDHLGPGRWRQNFNGVSWVYLSKQTLISIRKSPENRRSVFSDTATSAAMCTLCQAIVVKTELCVKSIYVPTLSIALTSSG